MNRITLILATVLSLVFTQVTAQDFNKGYEAYKLGDYSTALKEWKPLAEQGNEKAQYLLGWMYEKGKAQFFYDYIEALKWYRLAAEQGNAKAQNSLGLMYESGTNVLQDNQTSHMWYNIASANGDENAGGYRDERADLMTTEAIEKATAMARECMASDYKKCGY